MSPDNPPRKSRYAAPAKLLAGSALTVILSIGLCSIGGFSLEGQGTHPIVVNIGVLAFFGGLLGIAASILWFLIAAISGGPSAPPGSR